MMDQTVKAVTFKLLLFLEKKIRNSWLKHSLDREMNYIDINSNDLWSLICMFLRIRDS